MRKFIAKTAAVVCLSLAVVGLTATAASAHHTTVTGKATCNVDTGKFDLKWTIVNSEDKTATFTSRLGTGSLERRGTAYQYETGLPAGSYLLSVSARWSNGVTNTSTSQRVYASGTCERTRPPEPPADREHRDVTGEPNCKASTITTKHQDRSRTYRFDEQSWSWLPSEWSAWVTTSTSVADAGKVCRVYTAHVRARVVDNCNCWRDSVRFIADRSKVRISVSHPNRLTWIAKVTGRRAPNDSLYLLPRNLSGTGQLANVVTYKVRTTNKPCPCRKAHNCGVKHPNVPPHPSCRGRNCG